MSSITPPIAAALAQIYYAVNTGGGPIVPGVNGPWRPPQWISGQPPLTMTATDPATNTQTAYVFDTIHRIDHEQQSTITLNPVQNGAAITDHAYYQPARVVVEIAMSDAMQSYTVGQWAGGPSRSADAYQTMVYLQLARAPIALATRLRNYDLMIITGVNAPDTKETAYGLKCIVTFTEILTASITQASNPTSSIPQTTDGTTAGNVPTQPVPENIQLQDGVNPALYSTVPQPAGAGNYTSTGKGPLQSLGGIIP